MSEQTPNSFQQGGAQVPVVAKSRVAYILLGVLLGSLGIHNFYAGHTGRAVAQLLITVLSLGFLGFVSYIWAIVDICTVNQDANGVPFAS